MSDKILVLQGGELIEEDAPEQVVTRAQINAERDRRKEAGLPFDGHIFDFDAVSVQNIAGAATNAKFFIVMGGDAASLRWADAQQDFKWTTADNVQILMSAGKMAALGDAAAKWVAAHHYAGNLLKAVDPTPIDFTIDLYWPDSSDGSW